MLISYPMPLLFNPLPVILGGFFRIKITHWIHIRRQGLTCQVASYTRGFFHAFLSALIKKHIPEYCETTNYKQRASKSPRYYSQASSRSSSLSGWI